MKSSRDGEKSTAAVDAMNSVAPMAAAASLAPALPGATRAGYRAAMAAEERIGAVLQNSKHGDKAIKTAQFVEAFLNPNAQIAPSGAAALGVAAAHIKNEYRRRREQNKR